MTDQLATPEASRDVRLVVADVDGTLLTPDKVLTPRTRAAVHAVIDAGIAFTITSGRPPLGMKTSIDALPLEHPISAFNGGLFVRPDLSVVRVRPIPFDVVGPVIDTLTGGGLDVWIYTDTDWRRRVTNRRYGSIVLAGGSTPRRLDSLLASDFRSQIPWVNVQVFWGDERYVPPEDARSNFRMAKETLLDHVPCPPANIHPMPTHFPNADVAARDYELTLRSHFVEEWPRFDLVLLGIGDDGHTASLFPGSLALTERTRWVVAAQAPVEPHVRLTLTLPALTRARAVFVLVAGATKAEALRHVFEGAGDWIKYPAAGIRLANGPVIWWAESSTSRSVIPSPRAARIFS